jgi:hypothetical protein
MPRRSVRFHGKALTIACTDRKRSERFYEGVLGAERLPGDGYGCSWFRLGALTLNLMPNAAEPSPSAFPAHAMPIPWLEVDDLEAARRHLVGHKVPIIELHDGQVLTAADPDGLLIEVWQSETERFEMITIPELSGACGPVRTTLFETPFLRSARTGAVKPVENLMMAVDDEPFEGDFAEFIQGEVMWRCGSSAMKLKEHLPRVFYQCRVCQAMLPEEPGASYEFQIDLKPLDIPSFYIRLDAPAVACPRCQRHMILASDEVRGWIRKAVSEAVSGPPAGNEGTSI